MAIISAGKSPIDALPDETLAQIFLHFRADDLEYPPNITRELLEDRDPEWDIVEGLTWMSIQTVCRRWGAVVQGCPRLWANLKLTSHGLATRMLERARNVPISIRDLRRSGPPAESLLPIFSKCAPRAAHLGFYYVHDYFLPQLFNTLLEPAPHLTTLALERYPSGDRQPMGIPPHFLNGAAPELKSLTVSGVRLPWSSALYHSNLVILRLLDPHFSTSPSSLDAMLDAFERMPSLRDIDIYAGQPSLRPLEEVELMQYQRPPRTVKLLSARILAVRGSFGGVLTLLSCFATQQRTSLHVGIDSNVYPEHAQQCSEALRKVLQQHLDMRVPGGPPPPLRHVRLSAGSMGYPRDYWFHPTYRQIMASSAGYPLDPEDSQSMLTPPCPFGCTFNKFHFVDVCPKCANDFIIALEGPFNDDMFNIDPTLSMLPLTVDLSSVETLALHQSALEDACFSDPNWYHGLAKRCSKLRSTLPPRFKSFEDVPEILIKRRQRHDAIEEDPTEDSTEDPVEDHVEDPASAQDVADGIWERYHSTCQVTPAEELMTMDTARSYISLKHQDLPSWAVEFIAAKKVKAGYDQMKRCLSQSV